MRNKLFSIALATAHNNPNLGRMFKFQQLRIIPSAKNTSPQSVLHNKYNFAKKKKIQWATPLVFFKVVLVMNSACGRLKYIMRHRALD